MDPVPDPSRLPRWRGFNLLEKFTAGQNAPFEERDFALIAAWGFDFVRLPLSYRCWTSEDRYYDLREPVLREIDQAVGFGKRYDIHVCINFHRSPGYCVNAPAEPLDLWKDERALDAFAWQWAHFAQRYKGTPSRQLSFNLLNEPPFGLAEADYVRVVERLATAIRAEDPDRLILADGLAHGTVPAHGLVPLQVAQSTRGYAPMPISHFGANWVDPKRLACGVLTWPLKLPDGELWDKERLRRTFEPWQALVHQGVAVHVGEWGAFHRTPHDVTLAWMRGCLELWQEAGWGWALWNLRGPFGVIDSERADVSYENRDGAAIDRKMLELLQAG